MIHPEKSVTATVSSSRSMLESHDSSRTPMPASTRIYVTGRIHPTVRVPMREIALSNTTACNGRSEANEAVRVYDCSGPWGDPAFTGTVEQGLPPLRRDWILARRDVETYDGRPVMPIDNGYLNDQDAEYASQLRKSFVNRARAPPTETRCRHLAQKTYAHAPRGRHPCGSWRSAWAA